MPKIQLNPNKLKEKIAAKTKPTLSFNPEGRIYGLDLFSGIGGISLALEPWVQTVCYCEADRHAQAVLLSRMHEGTLDIAPIATDIKKIGKRNIDIPIDIIFGGFPCQDISTAGLGAGLAGSRSGLFFEIMRLARELRPSFLFLENVAAISSRGLDQVGITLTENGFDARWCSISASEVGAPHKRERWFCLAFNADKDGSNTLGEVSEGPLTKSRRVYTPSKVSNSDEDRRRQDFEQPKRKNTKRSENDSIFKFEPNSSINIRQNWEVEPPVGRVVDGLPYRLDRNERLGNAVVPLQARKAFEILMFGNTSL